MTRCHKESFESTEGQTCCPPTLQFSPWPQTHFLEIWTEIILSLFLFNLHSGTATRDWGVEKRPRTKRIRFAYTTPVTWDKNRFTGSWSQDTTPKNTFSPTPKTFSKYSIYRIRRVKIETMKKTGLWWCHFLGFWHENGPGIMQTRLLNIQWLKFFEIFAFWIFWIISSSSGNKCNKMNVTDDGE